MIISIFIVCTVFFIFDTFMFILLHINLNIYVYIYIYIFSILLTDVCYTTISPHQPSMLPTIKGKLEALIKGHRYIPCPSSPLLSFVCALTYRLQALCMLGKSEAKVSAPVACGETIECDCLWLHVIVIALNLLNFLEFIVFSIRFPPNPRAISHSCQRFEENHSFSSQKLSFHTSISIFPQFWNRLWNPNQTAYFTTNNHPTAVPSSLVGPFGVCKVKALPPVIIECSGFCNRATGLDVPFMASGRKTWHGVYHCFHSRALLLFKCLYWFLAYIQYNTQNKHATHKYETVK